MTTFILLDTMMLLYIFLAAALILGIIAFVRMCKRKVWINARISEKHPLKCIGYLQKDTDGTAAEVKLPSGNQQPSIARIALDFKSKQNVGFVEVLTSDIEDESAHPQFSRVGYISFEQDAIIDEEGYIYKQLPGQNKRELIGYTARPSKPNTPCIHGERSWKTLWLKSTLCAYKGIPHPEKDEKIKKGNQGEEKTEKNEKVVASHYYVFNAKKAQSKPLFLKKVITDQETQLVEAINTPLSQPEVQEEISNEPQNTEEVITEIPNKPENTEGSTIESPNESESIGEDGIIAEGQQPIPTIDESTTPQGEVINQEEPAVEESVSDASINEEPVSGDSANQESIIKEEKNKESLSDEIKNQLDEIKKSHPDIVSQFAAKMVKIEGGSFEMGGEDEEKLECPKHKVTVSSFYIGKYPITQGEWELIMGNNPSDCTDDKNYPVAPVSWSMANDFIQRLSYLTGISFSLPTEAQWEYAAKGGSKQSNYKYAGSNTFSDVGWSDHKHPVGAKQPNDLGLYDMSGLVREWCSDLWGHYCNEEQTNPVGPDKDSPLILLNPNNELCYVVRSPSGNETVTSRKGEAPELNKDYKSYGFRLVATNIPDELLKPTQNDAAEVLPLDKHEALIPWAVCTYTGFHSSKTDALPDEARACAYALLQGGKVRKQYSEYYKSQPYGWADTALLSSVVYTALFMLLYIINTGILELPLLGKDIAAAGILTGFYFIIWAIVRFIKIDAIENGYSFKPQLDLFNKNLGVKWMNIAIEIFAGIAIILSYFYYDYDFIPLCIAITIGISVNMGVKYANKRWNIKTSYTEDSAEDEEEDTNEIINPAGDIAKNYEWVMDAKYCPYKNIRGHFTLYFTSNEIQDLRHLNPFFSQRQDRSDKDCILDMFKFLTSHKTFIARSRYIANYIEKLAQNQQFTPLDKIQFTMDFVQEPNITFRENRECAEVNYYDNYIRYPDETLYDQTGDCNSKSLLAAMLFHEMHYNVLYLASRKHQHAAIGVEVKESDLRSGWYGFKSIDELAIKHEGHYYIYCEISADHFAVGRRIEGMSLDEFDETVLLPSAQHNVEDHNSDVTNSNVTRTFVWDLDSANDVKLHGTLAIEMDELELSKLRSINPFRSYGKDQKTYEDNIRSMFTYLNEDQQRKKHVRSIVEYIKDNANKASLSELDTIQFALDFCQEPNIKYRLDEDSIAIDNMKEYMRFPDEVLYDKEGDCDCKSSLTTALLNELGYNVLFILSSKYQHAAIAVEYKDEWLESINIEDFAKVVREYNGRKYLYCETTGDGFRVGHIKEKESIQEFEITIELLCNE